MGEGWGEGLRRRSLFRVSGRLRLLQSIAPRGSEQAQPGEIKGFAFTDALSLTLSQRERANQTSI